MVCTKSDKSEILNEMKYQIKEYLCNRRSNTEVTPLQKANF